MAGTIRFDAKPRRGWWWLALGVSALIAIGAWAWAVRPDEPARAVPAIAMPVPTSVSVASIGKPAADASSALAAPAAPNVVCPYQRLSIADTKAVLQPCVAATRVLQSGDLRSYLLDPQGVSRWSLRVDAVAGAAIAVALSEAGGASYRCDDAACSGVALGPRDAHGGRSLTLQHAVLRSVGAVDATVSVSAVLQVAGDQQSPALACAEAGVMIVQQDGAALNFCPGSGAGVAMAELGRRIFSLRNLEGDNLIVGVDAMGRIDHIEFAGLACHGDACGGATTRSAGEEANDDRERRFTFSGTSLSDGRSQGRSATLNGSVVLPPM